jgi:hypothetical protein
MNVPHIVALNIIKYIIPTIRTCKANEEDYNKESAIIHPWITRKGHKLVNLLRLLLPYTILDFHLDDFKNLRLTNTAFLDCLMIDMLHQKYDLIMFRRQYSWLMQVNDYLGYGYDDWYIYPLIPEPVREHYVNHTGFGSFYYYAYRHKCTLCMNSVIEHEKYMLGMDLIDLDRDLSFE